ncbi:MAG: hypothetical protein GX640_22960 [Fibrobacter sp.]|nr:hypothetical protein [Fibrobacter sp.]
MNLQTDGENRINFSILEELRFADRTTVVFESGITSPLAFNIFSGQFSQLSIGMYKKSVEHNFECQSSLSYKNFDGLCAIIINYFKKESFRGEYLNLRISRVIK